ncbi:hypothetical protein NDA11_005678 [Ustilago hordei]|uniref:Mediator of RNA polymerase II transcription subunit 4 n=1 Tax=Ustilago hordei TaxID=120017 RepID=I2FP56_USTHO|nr:related to conserved hypothetical protein [Ustilago hordei]KAJ1039800.1 hypothetical protein NDA10_006627 [Ustilago hordei]KAJ1580388.1 hypothetical protein NDA11_005678 [Ustilago hordei]KAJ1599607.1 hypothetical protein NDA14_006424 [Ustilago hordei]UTT90687.1 hypothetical protein NDA17_006609 [Ustilago hordei]CCF48699.1 conserved uncharacterized protein [Ustilago hordei]
MPSATSAGASTSKSESTTSALVLSTLSAYSDLTKQLFSAIENPSSLQKARTISEPHSDKTWRVTNITSILTALSEVDQLFSSRIELARQHALNQARIERLEAQAKKRDRETRQAILELSKIHSELSEISRMSQEEVAWMERAEKRPIGHSTLLAYAQRLAKYTSAPPGYKLPQVAAARSEGVGKREEEEGEGGEEKAISLGADYNQYAKRAAAYYDPAIPSMPQEMPFPSDAMMRQGILNSSEMLEGAPMAEQPAAGEVEMVEDQSEAMLGADFATSYSHLREEQREEVDDEDAFDLDLN